MTGLSPERDCGSKRVNDGGGGEADDGCGVGVDGSFCLVGVGVDVGDGVGCGGVWCTYALKHRFKAWSVTPSGISPH